MTLRITYLYPHHMNLYGDTGNIICLQKRCQWRDINTEIILINPGDKLVSGQTDIYFFGGGQDAQQEFVAKDLLRHQQVIKEDLENGVAALTICGGYQLFGHRFITKDRHEIPGIGVFDLETYGSDHRMIGNIIVEINSIFYQNIIQNYPSAHPTFVGFENHSGETKISTGSTIGETLTGYGNNYTSHHEGYHHQHAFGTYMHGSLLPKNPHLADYLISKAIEHQTHEPPTLSPLDDTLEWQSHQAILHRYKHQLKTAKL